MNDSHTAIDGGQLVAAPRWPHERRLAGELFELLHKDDSEDDEPILRLIAGDPREKLIAVLTVMKLAIFTPKRWSPDQCSEKQKKPPKDNETKPKEPRHLRMLGVLEAILGDRSLPHRLHAATVVAIAEIERQLVATKTRKLRFTGGTDPHVTHLLSWLTPDEPERCEAALWALSLIAPLNSTRTVQTSCAKVETLLGLTADEALCAAAAKLASGFGKRGRELAPALLARLKSGVGDAGCEIIDALFSVGHDPADRESIVAALDTLLRTTKDPRRLWLCVLMTTAVEPRPNRFLEPLQQIAAANDGPAALAARTLLQPKKERPQPCSCTPSCPPSTGGSTTDAGPGHLPARRHETWIEVHISIKGALRSLPAE